MPYKTTESILTAFAVQLLASTTVLAMIDDRLFFTSAAESPEIPYVVYKLDGSFIPESHSGQEGPEELEVQVEVYAQTPTQALRLRDAIVEHLKGFTGSVGGTQLHRISYDGQSDYDDPQGKTFGYLLDFTIHA